jgi:hypothetical protein
MAIRLDPEPRTDAQGLPVVTWSEDRNLFAPEGVGSARVVCFIRPDEDGVLQFVSVGTKRYGQFVETRPWQTLRSFEIAPAERLYPSALERSTMDWLRKKMKGGMGDIMLTDGALVMLANFEDERRSMPMHLNCASCSPVEMDMLHDRLTREFVAVRPYLVSQICDGHFVWSTSKPFASFASPPAPKSPSRLILRLIDLAIVMVLGTAAYAFYWLVAR